MNRQNSTDYIEHTATVAALSPKERTVTVIVDNGGECGSCPAARLCGVKDGKGEKITISDPKPDRFRVGERVRIRGTESLHRRAIMICTVVPCLLLIGIMIGVYLLTGSSPTAALSGVGAMVIFFLLMYLGRNKIAHEFTFTIQKG